MGTLSGWEPHLLADFEDGVVPAFLHSLQSGDGAQAIEATQADPEGSGSKSLVMRCTSGYVANQFTVTSQNGGTLKIRLRYVCGSGTFYVQAGSYDHTRSLSYDWTTLEVPVPAGNLSVNLEQDSAGGAQSVIEIAYLDFADASYVPPTTGGGTDPGTGGGGTDPGTGDGGGTDPGTGGGDSGGGTGGGSNGGSTSPVTFLAGNITRYQGDLYLALVDTDNAVAPVDGATWARLSTHGGDPAPLATTVAPTTAIDGWQRNADAQWGDLASDGESVTITSTYAGQFARFTYDPARVPAPIDLGASDFTCDMKIDGSAPYQGMSAGIVLSQSGEAGKFNFRLDANDDGTFGCRFEVDGQAGIVQSSGAVPFTLDAWHTLRFVRRGRSAAAYIDGTFVLGTDAGPDSLANGITVLVYGGHTAGAKASFRNAKVVTRA